MNRRISLGGFMPITVVEEHVSVEESEIGLDLVLPLAPATEASPAHHDGRSVLWTLRRFSPPLPNNIGSVSWQILGAVDKRYEHLQDGQAATATSAVRQAVDALILDGCSLEYQIAWDVLQRVRMP